jgi:thioredoxin 1
MRRVLIPVLAILSLLLVSPAVASDEAVAPFTPERFEALQKRDALILVEVHASWCPTCRAQAPIVDKLAADAAFSSLHALRLDWDTHRRQARAMGAPRQSTILLFKGERRIGRIIGETREDKLREFVQDSLQKAKE